MTEQDQIRALAELDGLVVRQALNAEAWSIFRGNERIETWHDSEQFAWANMPSYLTSYDAIIPLIQKQESHIQDDIWIQFYFLAKGERTVEWLCEALLRATGKWKD